MDNKKKIDGVIKKNEWVYNKNRRMNGGIQKNNKNPSFLMGFRILCTSRFMPTKKKQILSVPRR